MVPPWWNWASMLCAPARCGEPDAPCARRLSLGLDGMSAHMANAWLHRVGGSRAVGGVEVGGVQAERGWEWAPPARGTALPGPGFSIFRDCGLKGHPKTLGRLREQLCSYGGSCLSPG